MLRSVLLPHPDGPHEFTWANAEAQMADGGEGRRARRAARKAPGHIIQLKNVGGLCRHSTLQINMFKYELIVRYWYNSILNIFESQRRPHPKLRMLCACSAAFAAMLLTFAHSASPLPAIEALSGAFYMVYSV
jgi:hypothetical protein